jgi:hypothetical protein
LVASAAHFPLGYYFCENFTSCSIIDEFFRARE